MEYKNGVITSFNVVNDITMFSLFFCRKIKRNYLENHLNIHLLK